MLEVSFIDLNPEQHLLQIHQIIPVKYGKTQNVKSVFKVNKDLSKDSYFVFWKFLLKTAALRFEC